MTQERFQEIADLMHKIEFADNAPRTSMASNRDEIVGGDCTYCDSALCDLIESAATELFDYCLILRKQIFELTKDSGIPYEGDDAE